MLEGQFEYQIDEQRVPATAESFVYIPAGAVHRFVNVGASDARHLVITAPPEALDMIEAVYAAGSDQLAAVFSVYDTELVD